MDRFVIRKRKKADDGDEIQAGNSNNTIPSSLNPDNELNKLSELGVSEGTYFQFYVEFLIFFLVSIKLGMHYKYGSTAIINTIVNQIGFYAL